MSTTVVPEPTDCGVVKLGVARSLLVPHSNQAVVADPLGLMLAVTVALEEVTVDPLVSTVGGVLKAIASLKSHAVSKSPTTLSCAGSPGAQLDSVAGSVK